MGHDMLPFLPAAGEASQPVSKDENESQALLVLISELPESRWIFEELRSEGSSCQKHALREQCDVWLKFRYVPKRLGPMSDTCLFNDTSVESHGKMHLVKRQRVEWLVLCSLVH